MIVLVLLLFACSFRIAARQSNVGVETNVYFNGRRGREKKRKKRKGGGIKAIWETGKLVECGRIVL